MVTEKSEGTLEEAGFKLLPGARNSLVLSGLGHLPSPTLRSSPAVEDELSLGASASPTGTCTIQGGSSDYPPAPPLPPYLTSSSSTTSAAITEYSNTSSALIKLDTGNHFILIIL